MRAWWATAFALMLLPANPVAAQSPADEPPSIEQEAPADARQATPSPPAGEIALAPGSRLIPWDRLDETSFHLVRDVVGQSLVFRQVDGIAFRSHKEVYDYLFHHMDFAADLARMLRVGRYRARAAEGGFEADDGYGTHGFLKPVYDDGERRVFYVAGRYDPPILPTIGGRLVVVLDTDHTLAPDGVTYAEVRLAGYLRLDNTVAEVLATVLQAFSEAMLTRKVKSFFRDVARVSRRVYDDPDGVIEQVERFPGFDAERVAEFRRVLFAHRLPPWAEAMSFRLTPEPLTLDSGEAIDRSY